MRFPRFRFFTWFILAVNLLFLIWIIAGVGGSADTPCEGLDPEACEAARAVGTGIGVSLIVAFWVAADVILGVLWLITRRKTRDCPVCGRSVKRGATACASCGYDFAAAASHGIRPEQFPPNPGAPS